MKTTKTIPDGATRLTLPHHQQGTQHPGVVPSRHFRLDERVWAWRELAVTVAGRAVALRCALDGHPGAVAETDAPDPTAGRALKGSAGVGLLASSLLGAVRARMRLGLVRVEGVR